MRPTFLVIGAMKSGTRSLNAYLAHHPNIFVTRGEINFFTYRWDRGLGWYEGLFAAGRGAEALGEVSPSYTNFPGPVPERIAGTVPDVRMVYCLRDPVERTRAHYLHLVAGGIERRPFGRAISETPRYIECSRYVVWIERYLEHFDRSQLLLITSEGLRERRGETLDRILGFLGLPTGWRPSNLEREYHRTERKVAPRGWARPLWRRESLQGRIKKNPLARAVLTRPLDPERVDPSTEDEHSLRERFRPDVLRLAAYMEPGFDGWGLLRE
jgi:hypothetical protein